MSRKLLNEIQVVLEFVILILLFVPKMYMWFAEGAGYFSETASSFIQVMKNLKSVWMIIFLVLEVVAFGYYMVNVLFDPIAHDTIYMVIFPVVRLSLFGIGSAWLAVGMVRNYMYAGVERVNTCDLMALFYAIIAILAVVTIAEILKTFARSK